MSQNKVTVIGDRDSVLGFKALGVTVMTPGPGRVRESFNRAVKDEAVVIFITERFAEEVPDLIEDVAHRPIPSVVTIPDAGGSRGMGLKKLDDIIVTAVGSRLAMDNEEE
ncbi:MAG: V-type ATP synthase subunit F [Deltaproteobacteria bacterium]|nr:V-type ATP synthase subunit F [Candidatus Zymogenaceae bacterium]